MERIEASLANAKLSYFRTDSLEQIGMSVSRLVSLEKLWPGALPEAERLIFLQLRPDRQEMALLRLRAMNDYRSGLCTGQGLIEQLQVGKSQFYKLVRDWTAARSLESLVPHAKAPKVRKSKLDARVLELTETVLREHASANPRLPETKLVRIVQARAAGEQLPVPADESVRRVIARLTLEDANLSLANVGRMAIKIPAPQREMMDTEGTNFPEVFGGRLLLDHSTLDLIVEKDGVKFRPTISVVVDDATRLILSHQLIEHIPEPEDFLNILAFAANGYKRLQNKGISAVAGLHPVLTMRNGLSAKWNELRKLAESARFKFDIRRAPQPVFGHILRRSMITEIGGLQLLPRSTMQAPVDRLRSNDAGKPVVPWADAPTLVDHAVASHNRDRLLIMPDDVLRGSGGAINLRLNTDRRDWLDFGLAVFREAWAAR